MVAAGSKSTRKSAWPTCSPIGHPGGGSQLPKSRARVAWNIEDSGKRQGLTMSGLIPGGDIRRSIGREFALLGKTEK
jgi:hypothetical protein